MGSFSSFSNLNGYFFEVFLCEKNLAEADCKGSGTFGPRGMT